MEGRGKALRQTSEIFNEATVICNQMGLLLTIDFRGLVFFVLLAAL